MSISRVDSFLCPARDWFITGTWLTLWPLARKRRSCWFYRMWTVWSKFGLPFRASTRAFSSVGPRTIKIKFSFYFLFFVSRIWLVENGGWCLFARKVGRLCELRIHAEVGWSLKLCYRFTAMILMKFKYHSCRCW